MKNTGEKVDKWVNEVTKLADFSISQPQASYAAFTFGLRYRWTYFLRTLPDIAELLEPLEGVVNEVLLPAVTNHTVTKAERDLLDLPVRMGGLGFTDPVVTSYSEYEAPMKVTNPLVRQIVEQEHQPPEASEIQTLQLITTSRRFKCVPQILGSSSIHIFRLLFLPLSITFRRIHERNSFDLGAICLFCFEFCCLIDFLILIVT